MSTLFCNSPYLIRVYKIVLLYFWFNHTGLTLKNIYNKFCCSECVTKSNVLHTQKYNETKPKAFHHHRDCRRKHILLTPTNKNWFSFLCCLRAIILFFFSSKYNFVFHSVKHTAKNYGIISALLLPFYYHDSTVLI